jgi:hypothetical protein
MRWWPCLYHVFKFSVAKSIQGVSYLLFGVERNGLVLTIFHMPSDFFLLVCLCCICGARILGERERLRSESSRGKSYIRHFRSEWPWELVIDVTSIAINQRIQRKRLKTNKQWPTNTIGSDLWYVHLKRDPKVYRSYAQNESLVLLSVKTCFPRTSKGAWGLNLKVAISHK